MGDRVLSPLRRVLLGGALLLAACLAAAPASAAFVPGRFVVKGKPLAPAARKGISVHVVPQAVAVEGCRTRRARVRHRRGRTRLRATVRCGRRTVRLSARIRGRTMRGTATSRRRTRRFRARRARRPGVLLRGRSSRAATRAVRKVDRLRGHRRDQISKLGRSRVTRAQVIVRLRRRTTVGQVNRLLRRLGGGIVGSLRGAPTLIVAIPDPGTARALRLVLRRARRSRGIRSVSASAMLDEQVLPPGIASPPTGGQRAALSHLLASGVAAAWNARGAADAAQAPTVVVADAFADGALSPHVDAQSSPAIVDPELRGRSHGYQVASILFGDFASDGTAGGLVTGPFSRRGRLRVVDNLSATGFLSLHETAQRLIDTLDSVPSRVVVNTSLGRTGGQPDRDMFPEAADWIRNVRDPERNLEARVLHTTSAGNDASSARFNGLWAAAALRSDIQDELTGGTVGPLSNTLAIENVEEDGASSRLACLAPNSNLEGNLAGPGTDVYSLDRDGGVAPLVERSGTSFASPVVAGVATYLWSIAPDLTPQQLKQALVANGQPVADSEQNCVSAPRLDAYKALLSLDQPGPPAPSGSPVRLALLDLTGDRRFTQADLQGWIPRVHPNRPATRRDWSRHDLNGDGFSGGRATKAFDLDRSGSQRAGATMLTGVPVPAAGRVLNENAATDADVLCYYAHSPLYTGNPATRSQLLESLPGCGSAPPACTLTGQATVGDGQAFVEADTAAPPGVIKESESLPFVETASAGGASASQNSRITSTSPTLTLESSSTLSASDLDYAYMGLTRRFVVTGEGVCVRLRGLLSDSHSGDGSDVQRVTFTQEGAGSPLLDFNDGDLPDDDTFSATGQLGPGTYTLEIRGECAAAGTGETCTAQLVARLDLSRR